MHRRILAVEDDPSYQELLQAIFPYDDLALVSSSEQALERLAAGNFDLVICDVFLLGESGLEFMSHIKNWDPAIPVVMISGHAQPGLEERAKSLGAAGFLSKPFAQESLIALVDSLLKKREGGRSA
ncbi:MAG: response regulator [Elusimicrobia bacterium]|nr:response regulator [Elusimicrobiota bacterium]